ncbi:hypothetical protein HPE56_07435 [Maribacter sp. ANRC-HE7]|uniref:STAS/SEC14 domain-containing protein n=1 Tax=Maribacter aquimaris TaxID=2737171 RepID=A0ABR7V126_9FLAO|nr:hypothetical protein [Maribacter aquimaris]MBD0777620.1 hypothetical protein [Maribacter aquimaris]
MDTKFIKQSEFLYVDLDGDFSMDSFEALLKRIGTEDDHKVIIDGSKLQKTDISYEIRYELVIVAEKNLKEDVKYAVLWPSKDINSFTISNLIRLGITIQIFPKLAKAKKWLKITS